MKQIITVDSLNLFKSRTDPKAQKSLQITGHFTGKHPVTKAPVTVGIQLDFPIPDGKLPKALDQLLIVETEGPNAGKVLIYWQQNVPAEQTRIGGLVHSHKRHQICIEAPNSAEARLSAAPITTRAGKLVTVNVSRGIRAPVYGVEGIKDGDLRLAYVGLDPAASLDKDTEFVDAAFADGQARSRAPVAQAPANEEAVEIAAPGKQAA